MRTKSHSKVVRNQCGGKKGGCSISIMVLPYGNVRRKRRSIKQIVKAGIPIVI